MGLLVSLSFWLGAASCSGCCPPFLKELNEAENLSRSKEVATCPCTTLGFTLYVYLGVDWFLCRCLLQLNQVAEMFPFLLYTQTIFHSPSTI